MHTKKLSLRTSLTILTNPVETVAVLTNQPAAAWALMLQIAILAATLAIVPTTLSSSFDPDLAATNPNVAAKAFFWADVLGGIAFTIIAPVLTAATVALVAKFFGSFLGEAPSYKSYFSLVVHARIPLAIGTFVEGAATSLAYHFGISTSVRMDFTPLLSSDAPRYLHILLGIANPFYLWYLALLALGFSSINGVKAVKSTTLVAALVIVRLFVS